MAKQRLKIHLLCIDPQVDFCDLPGSALPVAGADADMKRAATMINRIGPRLDDIHVTLDSHRLLDIAHPLWWVDQNGNKPGPFTIISAADIAAGIWTPRNPAFRARSQKYAEELESTASHYKIMVWPAHCLIGTWGHNVHPAVNESLQRWSDREYAMVDYVTKGSNPWTEHYGAMMAEVPDPADPTTGLNTQLLQMLAEADIIGCLGEALSHCYLKTISQIADNIGDEHIKKFHLIRDCTSPVGAVPGGPDFPAISEDWLRAMKLRGMTITDSKAFLS
jgi:nicotinamidase-related amidase